VTLRRVGNAKYLGMMFHTVRGAHPDYTAIDVLGDVLTVAPSGRLYKALVETKKASGVDVWQQPLKDPGTMAFFAELPEGDAIAPAREAMLATFESIAKEPITEAEVARIQAKAAKYFDDVISDPQKLGIALSESVALAYLKRSNLTAGAGARSGFASGTNSPAVRFERFR
jgi:zinc protease